MASIASQWLSPRLEGCRVRLQMSEDSFEGSFESTIEGVVVRVSQESSTVTLDQGVVLENPMRRKYVPHQEVGGPRLLRVTPKRNSAHNSDLICHRQETDTSEVIKKGIIKLIGTPDDLPNLRRPIATDFEVIDEVNDQLSEAIAAIRKERTISVAYEGVEVGRHGHLSVLAVVASSKVYVFDVQKIKKDLFDHGLKEIFESDGIEKVADVIIYINKKLESGDFQFPPYLRGVQSCLRIFLNLTRDQLKYTRSRLGRQEDQVCNWGQRPLSLRQIDALVKDVVYLGELAHVCLEQMLQKFRMGVEFFLGLYRDCSEEELLCLPPVRYLQEITMTFCPWASGMPSNLVPCVRHQTGLAEAMMRTATENMDILPEGIITKATHHQYRDSLRHGRGFSSMNNDCVHSRQPRHSYRQECNQKQNDHYNVKKGKRTEDSLLYIAMQPQTNKTSAELSDPATDIARKSNVGESEKLNASSEPTESMQEEPATSALQDQCPVSDGNSEDSKAGREATDEPHPDTSFCSFERDVRFPAPRCSSMRNGVDAFRRMLPQHFNDNGPPCNIPSGNHDSGHQV